MYILEDAAQGFGGAIGERRACSFGDISTTSFFPAKPLGCYGDGGAIFTNNEEWAELLRSLAVHGKGKSKYDNVRIGMNSRLDTLQAAILAVKFPVFVDKELNAAERLAEYYTEQLAEIVKVPVIKEGYKSSWAQYTIQLENEQIRDGLRRHLEQNGIPSMIYYQKPMHTQKAFSDYAFSAYEYADASSLCETVLSLPFHPYMSQRDASYVIEKLKRYREYGECLHT